VDRLKLGIKRKVSKYIMNHFNEDKKEISQYLFENRNSLVENLKLDIEPDDIIFTIADSNNPDFQEFIKVLMEEIKKADGRSKINLITNHLTYYLEKSTLGISINNGLKYVLEEKLLEIKRFNSSYTIYEEFCALFLQDFMFSNVKITKASNDLGIDITGEYDLEVEANNQLIDYLLPKKIYLLSQVKFYDSLVDTSYIRKLIGDSLFIRFDQNKYFSIKHNPLYLIFFSHSGFTEEAKKFAEENKICIIDSKFMLDLICSRTNSTELKSLNFLLNVIDNL